MPAYQGENKMKVITTVKQMQKTVQFLKKEGKQIGFVPTMGFLHDGHLSLVEKAKEHSDIIVISIFVNPLQFGPSEDYDSYPQDIERDKQAAADAGVDIVFIPTVEEMYPEEMSINLSVVKRVNVLCGKNRVGHFDGVITVLSKFFHIVLPDQVYFGLKDAQQVAVVDGLIHDLYFPIELITVDTVREEDGLAKSSRNVYLSNQERIEAVELYKSLQVAKKAIIDGERNKQTLIHLIKNHLQVKTNGKIDYIEIHSYPQLEPLETLNGTIIIAVAVKFSKARLIDNIILTI